MTLRSRSTRAPGLAPRSEPAPARTTSRRQSTTRTPIVCSPPTPTGSARSTARPVCGPRSVRPSARATARSARWRSPMSTASRWTPSRGVLYGVHRRGGAGELDALFRINPTTGAFVPGGFTGGADYVLVQAQAGLNDIDDLSISALDGQMLAVANNSTGDRIVRIDRFTGATVDVGRIQVSGVNLDDVEGFGSDSQGTLWATHGRTPYDLYRINPTTAAATIVHAIPTGGDHESVACLTGEPNRVTGTVFNDTNGNGVRNAEPGTANITATLYRDTNGNGLVDAGDVAVATTTTDVNGNYSFAVSSTGKFAVAITTRRPAGRTPHDDRQRRGRRLRHVVRAARRRERLRVGHARHDRRPRLGRPQRQRNPRRRRTRHHRRHRDRHVLRARRHRRQRRRPDLHDRDRGRRCVCLRRSATGHVLGHSDHSRWTRPVDRQQPDRRLRRVRREQPHGRLRLLPAGDRRRPRLDRCQRQRDPGRR